MDILLFRGVERLLAVIIGGVAIYLGYRLFQTVVLPADGALEAKIDGYGSLIMSRIGPGIFFALFGAAVVITSLAKPVSLSESVTPATPAAAPSVAMPATTIAPTTTRSYSGVSGTDDPEARGRQRAEARQTLSRLGRIPPLLDGGVRTDAEEALKKARLALIGEVWDPAWGHYGRFRDEALTGDLRRLPDPYGPALDLFRHGVAP